MDRVKILIVEDEDRMRRLIGDYLKKEGYTLIEAENGRLALEKFFNDNIDLVILDIMLPEYDGWTVMREIRKESNVPIIILTARSEESDELFGFEFGADEYVTKPFSPKVLVARVKALLRRSNTFSREDMLKIGSLELDLNGHRVFNNGVEIKLTPKEYELLVYMAKNKGKALSRETLLNGVWGYDYYGDFRTVDTHIKRLRLKLKENSHIIETVRGVGYRLEVKE